MKEGPSNLSPDDLARAERIAYLVAGYLRQRLTVAEQQELDDWVGESDEHVLLFEDLIDEENITAMMDKIRSIDTASALERTKAKINFRLAGKTLFRKLLPYLAAAALIGFAIAIFFMNHPTQNKKIQPGLLAQDIKPGGNKAMLTLANGAVITLDNMQVGELAKQGSESISKIDSGKLAYSTSLIGENSDGMNVLTTPRGGQYQIVLGDGTHVWLNAQSSIRYPVSFSASDRTVELEGEAYFEVAKDAARPFFVRSGSTEIKVLGTHFNVNAYPEEKEIKTTLLEGAVKVLANGHSVLIKPGEQAVVKDSTSSIQVIDAANTDQAVAWKNGLFHFDHTDLSLIMLQLSRWYDVEISYTSPVTGKKFTGKISRNSNASQVLDMLGYAGAHFKIEGKKIIVMP